MNPIAWFLPVRYLRRGPRPALPRRPQQPRRLTALEERVTPAVAYAVMQGVFDVGGSLIRFDTRAPDVVQARVGFSGLDPGDTFSAIDFSSANGQLYGLATRPASGPPGTDPGSKQGRLY